MTGLIWRFRQFTGFAPEDRDLVGDSRIICPYCHQRGDVHVTVGREKQGFSTGKVVAAIVTLGFTLLLTGLARKDDVTRLECDNCGMGWRA